MSIIENINVKCHHCLGLKNKFVIELNAAKYFYCLNCALLFSSYVLSDKDINQHYVNKRENEKDLEERFRFKHMANLVREKAIFGDLENVNGIKTLDIGCGEGSFVYSLNKIGAEAYGIEPVGQQAEYGIRKYKLNIKNEFYELNSFPKNSFNLITINRVLEHMPNPIEIVEIIHFHLKDHGLLFIDVPSYRMRGGQFTPVQFGYMHLRLYDMDSLEFFLNNNGFEIVKTFPDLEPYGHNYKPGVACLARKACAINDIRSNRAEYWPFYEDAQKHSVLEKLKRLEESIAVYYWENTIYYQTCLLIKFIWRKIIPLKLRVLIYSVRKKLI